MTKKTKEQLLVESVTRELCEMRGDRMLDHDVRPYPKEMVDVKPTDLPLPVRTLFIEFVADFIRIQRDVREQDGESFVFEEETRLTFRHGTLDGRAVWMLGMHEPTSPYNPSGHDFYAFDDGSFYGWAES